MLLKRVQKYEINTPEFIEEAVKCEALIKRKLKAVENKQLQLENAKELLLGMEKKLEILKKGILK